MAAEYVTTPATLDDARDLAARARAADVAELAAAAGVTPLQALETGLEVSAAAWCVRVDGDPVAIFGVVPLEGQDRAVAWLTASDLAERHPAAFAQASLVLLDQLLDRWPCLVNFVDARNRTAIRWLRWLGATIHPAQPYGKAGLPFHFFEIRR